MCRISQIETAGFLQMQADEGVWLPREGGLITVSCPEKQTQTPRHDGRRRGQLPAVRAPVRRRVAVRALVEC